MDMTGGQSVLFVEDNYRYILYGMNYYPALNHAHQPNNESDNVFDHIKVQAQKVQKLQKVHVTKDFCIH